ncbi:MAG TPA: SDR family oxidoreductase [Rhizomicrobium sp.]|jgi:nucleoside-diphosphate-sugar epimerase
MRVFLTGATGFVGSAVTQNLIAHGHKVVGLARSDANAAALTKAGVEVHRGSLEDLGSLRSGAAKADGVIHCAFIHDFSKYAENGQIDAHAIAAMCAVLEGSNRPLIVTSGTAILSPGRLATEDDVAPEGFPRMSEKAGLAFAARGVRAMAIRLSPTVHGDGDKGFVPMLIALAREKGVSAYVGDGANRWSAVHRLDAADLYRRTLEKGVAGACYHGVAEEGVAFKDIATIIGRRLNIPVVGKSAAEAPEHFGWFAMFAGIDAPTSSEKTRKALGWEPNQQGLLADLDNPRYFGS